MSNDKLNPFTCEEMFRRLDDYVDRELSAEETELARRHLEVCEVCAREYRFQSSLVKSVRAKLNRIDVSPDLLMRIRAGLAAARPDGEASQS